jgi:nucleotide-binding universal stress UspA family protein
MSTGTLVTLAPGEISERGLLKKCELGNVLGLGTARVLVSRRTIPYSKILAVFDGSEGSRQLIELALKIAIHTGSSLHVLDISENEGDAPDLEHLKRLGQSRNVEVKELYVEGNPTLDLVALVTGGDYDLLAIRWSCQNVRRDILRRVIGDSKLSVLLVG